MPSLRSINKEAGTHFRRWKEVTAVVKEANEVETLVRILTDPTKPTPIPDAVPTLLIDHPDIAEALAEGWTLKDVENGRNAARRMHGKIAAAQHRHGKDSPEVQTAIDEANRVSVMLTTARAAYNRITYPERYI